MSDIACRILIATDAWRPQVNGVVRTLAKTIDLLTARGHRVEIIEPGLFTHFPCPIYPEIALSLPDPWLLAERIEAFAPQRVHIATEGPIGLAVRAYCLRNGWQFTTSYHTKFPEYLQEMLYLPSSLSYSYMKWFHKPASAMFVATPSIEAELRQHGFTGTVARWSRGVDLDLFRPRSPKPTVEWPRPIWLSVGRLSREKNLEAFLGLKLPGTKVLVGDGPHRVALTSRDPKAIFCGALSGEPLAEAYASADVFVFASKTDTFGLVMLEAMACGVPVAAFDVPGPRDVVVNGVTGFVGDDLGEAARRALTLTRPEACVEHARRFRWEECTRQFFEHLTPIAVKA